MRDWSLPAYTMALTHSTWTLERGGQNNERLEFFGDAVLQLCVSRLLFEQRRALREDRLSELRRYLVNNKVLARIGAELGLGPHVRLGNGEELQGGRNKEKVLAGAFEAVLATIFEREGLEATQELVNQLFLPLLPVAEQTSHPKTDLQHMAQRLGWPVPTYAVRSATGPDNERTWEMEVHVNGEELGVGRGRTKNEAECAAAIEALAELRRRAA